MGLWPLPGLMDIAPQIHERCAILDVLPELSGKAGVPGAEGPLGDGRCAADHAEPRMRREAR